MCESKGIRKCFELEMCESKGIRKCFQHEMCESKGIRKCFQLEICESEWSSILCDEFIVDIIIVHTLLYYTHNCNNHNFAHTENVM